MVTVKPEEVKTTPACEWGTGQILEEIKWGRCGAVGTWA